MRIPLHRRGVPPLDYCFSLNQASPQARGLLAWWPMLATRGTYQVADLYGGANGTFDETHAPAWNAQASLGAAIDFGAANVFVKIPETPNLMIVNNFSIAFWAFIRTFSTGSLAAGVLISKFGTGGGGNDGRGIRLEGTGSAVLLVTEQSSNVISVAAAKVENAYHAFVLTSNADGSIFYVDGVSQGTGAQLTAWFTGTGGLDLRFGSPQSSFFNSGGNSASFLLDEVRFYDHALTAQETVDLWAPQTRWELYAPPAALRFWSVPAGGAPVGDGLTHGQLSAMTGIIF